MLSKRSVVELGNMFPQEGTLSFTSSDTQQVDETSTCTPFEIIKNN